MIFLFIIFKTVKYDNYISLYIYNYFLSKTFLPSQTAVSHFIFAVYKRVKISGPSWAELTNGPISYFIYEEPPGALSPTCPGAGPLVSMCERLFGKSGSFGGEGWFP